MDKEDHCGEEEDAENQHSATRILESTNVATPVSANSVLRTPSSSRVRSQLTGSGRLGQNLSGVASASSTTPVSSSRFRPRVNPFDSGGPSLPERMQMPTVSPSMFNVVQSPSVEDHKTSTSGQATRSRFWSLDQQAHLFPAEISDDSPWKQETATSVLDPAIEDQTQEAIELYFSQHHTIKSPEEISEQQASTSQAAVSRLLLSSAAQNESLGSSPKLAARSVNSSGVHNQVCRWSQTVLSFPAVLPENVESILAPYFTFHQSQKEQSVAGPVAGDGRPGNILSSSEGGQLQNSLSTSRRKLFEGMVEDSSDEDFEALPRSSEGDPVVDAAPKSPCEAKEDAAAVVNHHLMSSPIKEQLVPGSDDFLSPGPSSTMSLLTPIKNAKNNNGKNPTWSSSPIKRKGSSRRTSVTPPPDVGSPTFSPIGQSTKLMRTTSTTGDEDLIDTDEDEEGKENKEASILRRADSNRRML